MSGWESDSGSYRSNHTRLIVAPAGQRLGKYILADCPKRIKVDMKSRRKNSHGWWPRRALSCSTRRHLQVCNLQMKEDWIDDDDDGQSNS